MPSSSLLERMASIREGSSCGANSCLIKRPQAVTLKLGKRNRGAVSILYKIGMGRAYDIPLSNTGVVALEARAPTPIFSLGDEFDALRVPSIRRISTM